MSGMVIKLFKAEWYKIIKTRFDIIMCLFPSFIAFGTLIVTKLGDFSFGTDALMKLLFGDLAYIFVTPFAISFCSDYKNGYLQECTAFGYRRAAVLGVKAIRFFSCFLLSELLMYLSVFFIGKVFIEDNFAGYDAGVYLRAVLFEISVGTVMILTSVFLENAIKTATFSYLAMMLFPMFGKILPKPIIILSNSNYIFNTSAADSDIMLYYISGIIFIIAAGCAAYYFFLKSELKVDFNN